MNDQPAARLARKTRKGEQTRYHESMLHITDRIQIPPSEIEITFARSGGPGGQNVNKVNSKAILRWNVASSTSVPEPVRRRFVDTYGTRITADGDLILTGQKYRDQISNSEDCLNKLREMILAVEKPPTVRRATRPTLASKERRIESKVRTSKKKDGRKQLHVDRSD